MSEHSEPGDLALRAVGGAATHAALGTDAHLGSCARCQSELDQLQAVVASVRTVRPEDYPTAPPPAVWDAVLTELGLAAAATPPADELAVRRARKGRRTTSAVAAVAAAVGLIAGVVAGASGAVLLRDDHGGQAQAVVASAQLGPLGGIPAAGEATVHGDAAGRVLTVSVQDLTEFSGLHEVWLITADGKKLVSLGLLEGPSARFTVPLAVNIDDFSVVDVSVENPDGNPAHSGNSVLRGQLSS